MVISLKQRVRVSFDKLLCFFKKYKIPFIIIGLLLLLSVSSILRANFKYVDDIGRTVNGYRGWSNFSRYLSSFLSIFLHGDTYLTDISPLPQILAIVLMSISSVLLLHLFSKYCCYKNIILYSIFCKIIIKEKDKIQR